MGIMPMLRRLLLAALVATASAVARRDGKDEVLFQPSTPRGPFTEQPPAIKKDCHDKIKDGYFCELKSGACENRCLSGAYQHVVTKDVRAGRGQCCTKQDALYKCRDRDAHRICCDGFEEVEQVLYRNQTTGKFVRSGFKSGMCSCFQSQADTPAVVREGYADTPRDQFEARPYKYEAPPKKLPGANCTKWEMSHVRTVIAKLKMKTNETKPSEWNIMTGQGRINAKDGLRVLPPKPVFLKTKKNVTNITANVTAGNGSLVL